MILVSFDHVASLTFMSGYSREHNSWTQCDRVLRHGVTGSLCVSYQMCIISSSDHYRVSSKERDGLGDNVQAN